MAGTPKKSIEQKIKELQATQAKRLKIIEAQKAIATNRETLKKLRGGK